MKKGLLLCASALFALTLTGCGETSVVSSSVADASSEAPSSSVAESSSEEESSSVVDPVTVMTAIKNVGNIGVSYREVSNSHNVILKTTVIAKSSKVISVNYEEGFFLTDNALLTGQTAPEGMETLTVSTTSNGTTTSKYYAKYMKVNGVVYTGAVRDTAVGKETLIWSTTGVTDYFADTKDSTKSAAAVYFEALKAGKVVMMKSATEEAGLTLGAIVNNGSLFKNESTNGYWTTGTLGWKGNVSLVEKALVGKDISSVVAARDSTTKACTIDGVATGASMTEFTGYIDAAKDAFTKATAANADRAATGYQVLNTNCVDKIDITIDADNKVTSAQINETVYGTDEAAYLKGVTTATDDMLSVTTTNWSGEVTKCYAKYLKIGDTVYTGTVRDAALAGENIQYASSNDDDLTRTINKNPSWYYNHVLANDISIVDSTGAALKNASDEEYPVGYIAEYTSGLKAESNNTYWTTGTLGWKGNAAKFEAALVGLDLNATANTATQDATSKIWSIGTVSTGATISAFSGWYTLAAATASAAE